MKYIHSILISMQQLENYLKMTDGTGKRRDRGTAGQAVLVTWRWGRAGVGRGVRLGSG